MKLYIPTDTWSIECGDEEYYANGVEYKLRLIFDAESLIVADGSIDSEFKFEHLTHAKIKVNGKVIFKDEYLLIVEGVFRFGIVLNNQFRFGNQVYIGNKEIDHSLIQVGDFVEGVGYFSFRRLFFCIFTFLPDEFSLPDIDYMWRVNNIFKIDDETWDVKQISELVKVNEIDTSSQSFDDVYVVEFELINDSVLPFDDSSGIHGFVKTICWIDERNFVRNCEGRIINGIKKGEWFYLDKRGENRKEFHYEE